MRVSAVLGKTDHRRRAEDPCMGSNLNEPSLSLASSSDVFFKSSSGRSFIDANSHYTDGQRNSGTP
jgi:hypothetical protein